MKPINIKDERQRHFEKLAKEVDDYDKNDRMFMLWYLMEEYINDLSDDISKYEDANSIEDWLKYDYAKKHRQCARDMRNVLSFSVF